MSPSCFGPQAKFVLHVGSRLQGSRLERGTQLGLRALASREGFGSAVVLEVQEGGNMVEVDTKLGLPTSFVLELAPSIGMTPGLVVRLSFWFGVGFNSIEEETPQVRSWETDGSP